MTTIQLFWLLLGSAWTFIELAIAFKTRIKITRTGHFEFRSERLIWIVVVFALFTALWVKQKHLAMMPLEIFYRQFIAILFFVFGLALRCYAVFSLGKFFSTSVKTSDTHILIEYGPYRFIRHPAYTGLFFSFLGAGFAMGDALALLTLISPIAYVLTQRIRIEELWLNDHFGNLYDDYSQRTKKLLPWIY
jgi:protein-S-isoprenylcysteine O-methyltransferase